MIWKKNKTKQKQKNQINQHDKLTVMLALQAESLKTTGITHFKTANIFGKTLKEILTSKCFKEPKITKPISPDTKDVLEFKSKAW